MTRISIARISVTRILVTRILVTRITAGLLAAGLATAAVVAASGGVGAPGGTTTFVMGAATPSVADRAAEAAAGAATDEMHRDAERFRDFVLQERAAATGAELSAAESDTIKYLRQDAAERAARDAERRELASLSPRELGQRLAAAAGWAGSQWSCLDALWTRESNWNPAARNRSSGAFGIPQALPGAKMASAGADWATNPATQIAWGLGYIRSVYGTPCGAWGHSQSHGWY